MLCEMPRLNEPPDDTGHSLKRYVIRFAGSKPLIRTADTAVEALAAIDEMIVDWVFSIDSITDRATGEALTIPELENRAVEEKSNS